MKKSAQSRAVISNQYTAKFTAFNAA